VPLHTSEGVIIHNHEHFLFRFRFLALGHSVHPKDWQHWLVFETHIMGEWYLLWVCGSRKYKQKVSPSGAGGGLSLAIRMTSSSQTRWSQKLVYVNDRLVMILTVFPYQLTSKKYANVLTNWLAWLDIKLVRAECVHCTWAAGRNVGGHYKWHFFSFIFFFSPAHCYFSQKGLS
jgi:hypothetical protein